MKILKDLESTQNEFWNIGPKVGQFIYDYILENEYKIVLEIGSSNGYSGIWIASALKDLSQKNGFNMDDFDPDNHQYMLYTIESNLKKRYPLALENFNKSGLGGFITPILGHAPEDIPKKPKMFDFAFFDATKHEHVDYFNVIKDRINVGGSIITDNISSHREAFGCYIETLKNLPNWESREVDLGTGLLISRRVK